MYTQRSIRFIDEKELLSFLKQDDEQAFVELYQRYSVRILQKLIKLVKEEEVAKELLQDIFLKIWEKRKFLDPEKCFAAYLFRITENLVADFFRRVAYERKLMTHLISVSSELYNHTEEVMNYKEVKEILHQALEALPPQRKKIYTLCKIEGKSYEEAGALLGISSGTVNDHMVKATRALKKHYKQNHVDFMVMIAFYISF